MEKVVRYVAEPMPAHDAAECLLQNARWAKIMMMDSPSAFCQKKSTGNQPCSEDLCVLVFLFSSLFGTCHSRSVWQYRASTDFAREQHHVRQYRASTDFAREQ